jgi:hypothetical protein
LPKTASRHNCYRSNLGCGAKTSSERKETAARLSNDFARL